MLQNKIKGRAMRKIKKQSKSLDVADRDSSLNDAASQSFVQFKKLPPALQSECRKVQDYLNRMSEFALRHLWKLGRRLHQIETDGSGKFGRDPIGAMSSVLDFGPDRGRLARILHFYRDFPEDLLEWTLRQRMRLSRRQITWSHIIWIMSLPTLKDRRMFLEKTFANDWSADQLVEEIRRYLGRPVRGGGRPLAIPRTLELKLDNMTKVLKVYVRNDREIWRHPQHGILAALASLPSDSDVSRVREKIDNAIKLVESAATAATEQLALLQEARARLQPVAALPEHSDDESD